MKKLLFLIFLSGCSTTSIKEIKGPNGNKAFSINCKKSIDSCYESAAVNCPGGYNIINQSEKTAYAPYGGMIVPIQQINLFIECKQITSAL